ncbi:P-loop containing nucleoside triphosphate hydrolase protein, partial [Blyttiomyces helicus]
VEQDDALYPNMTVRETLRTAAYLRLPTSRYTRDEKNAQAEAIIKSLRLTKAADTRIGDGLKRGVSGGERKRAAIGQELVGNPDVLFLDEPTSGLDSNSAYAVIENVRSEAVRTGRVVVLTIHQPSIEVLYLFSKVILLSAGATVFFGPPDDALAHFDRLGLPCPPKRNPADFFLDILTIDHDLESEPARIRALHDAYRGLEEERKMESGAVSGEIEIVDAVDAREDPLGGWANSWWEETGILYRRAWTEIFRNRPLIMAEFAQTIIVMLVMGLAFLRLDNDTRGIQNRAGILFFWPINQVSWRLGARKGTWCWVRTSAESGRWLVADILSP